MPRPKNGETLIGPYAKPKVRCSGCTFQPGTLQLGSDQFIPLDTAQWLAWLDQKLAFRVEQVYYLADRPLTESYSLSYTVRPEQRQRGQLYWYPYKKYHNKRLKGTYLGRSQDITLAHLDQLANQYLAQIEPEFYTQLCQVGLRFLKKYHNPHP